MPSMRVCYNHNPTTNFILNPDGSRGSMNIPNNITNPNTLRRWERTQKESEELEQFAKEKGCIVFKRATNNWGFKCNGLESPYGFDTDGEVYIFIKKHNANTGIV